jgi:uroporphyrinogen-III decarboxylase
VTGKLRVHAALEGRPVDRMPVAALYSQLYHQDHFAELTGRPPWQLDQWLHEEPAEHLRTFRTILERAPFETIQPQRPPSREVRERTEFFERDGQALRHDRITGEHVGHAREYTANEAALVRSVSDVDGQVAITSAEAQLASGVNDYLDAAVAALGDDHFILSGGVVGTLYGCSEYIGLTNLFSALALEPELIERLSQRILEQNVETIHALAAAGGDAIYIDDAMATNDMISVAHYERFCVPTTREMVREVHATGHKAILIYFGGVADRLEQIASLGADGLLVETSMKGYTNDIGQIVGAIGDRVTLFGNIDPVGCFQDGSPLQVEAEIKRQVRAGRSGRGFIISPASPITPATPLERVRRFIELAVEYGTQDVE